MRLFVCLVLVHSRIFGNVLGEQGHVADDGVSQVIQRPAGDGALRNNVRRRVGGGALALATGEDEVGFVEFAMGAFMGQIGRRLRWLMPAALAIISSKSDMSRLTCWTEIDPQTASAAKK